MFKQLLLFCLLLNHVPIPIQADGGNTVWNQNHIKLFSALLLTGGGTLAACKLKNVGAAKKLADALGVNSQDLGNVVGLTAILLASSVASSSTTKDALTRFACRAPIAAVMTTYVATHPVFKSVVTNIPIVGKQLECTNKNCQGSCNDCKLTSGVLGVGLYKFFEAAYLEK